ncbi:MAG: sporulation protein YqfD, partial [Clostridiales bacterium]
MNNQWAHIWGGAVDIEIIGQEPERFLNLALARNLDISGVRRDSTGRLYLRLALGDMGYLRELSRLSHCRFRICRRYGLPFLLRFIRHRPMLPVAGFCCLFLLIWLSSLVWGIEIVGPYPISPERQQRLLFLSEQAGVSLYASRWGMDLEA